MVPILQVFYSVFSGLMLSVAIPNELYLLGFPFITLFALVPFYIAIRASKNYKYAFMCGWFQTATTHFASSFWLAYFKDFAALTLGASGIATGVIGGVIGLLLYLPYSSSKAKNELNNYSLSQSFLDSSCFKVIYFAAVYTIWEWVKSNGFFGYPWGALSGTMYNWPVMMQIADITGTYGISFIFAFANAVLGELFVLYSAKVWDLDKGRKKDLITAAKLCTVLFAVTFAYGVFQCSVKRLPQKFISTILVQQNSDPWKEKTDKQSILNSQELTRQQIEIMNEESRSPDLIVWSEGTLKYPLPSHKAHYELTPVEKPLTTFIKEVKTPLLTGGSWLIKGDHKKYYNAAIVYDENGNIRGHYSKNHLVPCAEALPGMEYPAIRKFMTKVIHISASWTPGDQYAYFDIPCSNAPDKKVQTVVNFDLSVPYSEQKKQEDARPTVKISTPICFDDCFPDIMRPLFLNGSEVFMNITDDSWSLKKSSEYQHFVNSSYSAIEYRTTLVRSTNAGYSVVLDPTGKILADLPLFESAAMNFDVPVYERKLTTYARFGNWLPYLLLILTALYCIYEYLIFTPSDYIPSERKIKNKKKKKHHKK